MNTLRLDILPGEPEPVDVDISDWSTAVEIVADELVASRVYPLPDTDVLRGMVERVMDLLKHPVVRCSCGHTYQFHQEHWPACKGFTPVTK